MSIKEQRGQPRTSVLPLLGVPDPLPLIGLYLPSTTANVPDEEPSTNSIGGGKSALKASMSLAGRYCARSCGSNTAAGCRVASILSGIPRCFALSAR